MKSLFTTFLITLISCLFISCNKCQECTCDSVTDIPYTEEVCRDNFHSNEDYNEAITTLESVGCSCN